MEPQATGTWLGSTVLYANRDGRAMAAIVCGTEATPDAPAMPGTLHLTVFSPISGPYVKHHVHRAPEGASEPAPQTWLPTE